MNKLNLLVILTFIMLACNSENKIGAIELVESAPFNLPVSEGDGLYLKTLVESGDTMITVFSNKDSGQVIRTFFIDTLPVKIDTIQLEYPFKNQSYMQVLSSGELLIFTPLDSIRLRVIASNHTTYYTKEDFKLFNDNAVTFSEETKLITDFKSNSSNFEYRITSLSGSTNYPMSGGFNLDTKELKFEGINYPERYQTNYYGFLQEIQEVYTDSLIIYNPIALPEIWVFDRATKNVEVKEVRSRFQLEEVEIISEEDKKRSDIKTIIEEHQASNGNYSRLIYNPYLHQYYRFYQHPKPEKMPNGYFATYKDRKVSVIQMDENLKPIAEFLLPSSCFFIYTVIPTREGFIVNNGALFENDQMQLLSVKM